MHERRCGGFFQSFLKSFSKDISCLIPCRSSRMPSQSAHFSLIEVPGHRERGSFSSAWGGGSGFFKYSGLWPRSAAPTAGLRGLLPKFDCSIVTIFMGVQGWDLATWNKKETEFEFLFTSQHHTQIVTVLQRLHSTESRGASGVTLFLSLLSFFPLSLC